MISFDHDALYSIEDLREMLHGVVELPTFLERLGLREKRVFRDAVWGSEILEARNRAKPYTEVSVPDPRMVQAVMSGSRKNHGKGSTESVGRITSADFEKIM